MRLTHHNAPMAEGNPKRPKSPNKQLSDCDTSEEEQVDPRLKTSEEERHYGTIHGSTLATQIAISHSRAQANLTIERGPEHKVRIKKLLNDKANDKLTQTSKGGNKTSDL